MSQVCAFCGRPITGKVYCDEWCENEAILLDIFQSVFELPEGTLEEMAKEAEESARAVLGLGEDSE